MLEPLQIMSGFKDIKTQIRTKYNLPKKENEFALWFDFKDDSLTAHDYENHRNHLTLATFTRNHWQFWLKVNSPGRALIDEAIVKNKNFPNQYLNKAFLLNGFAPLNIKN